MKTKNNNSPYTLNNVDSPEEKMTSAPDILGESRKEQRFSPKDTQSHPTKEDIVGVNHPAELGEI